MPKLFWYVPRAEMPETNTQHLNLNIHTKKKEKRGQKEKRRRMMKDDDDDDDARRRTSSHSSSSSSFSSPYPSHHNKVRDVGIDTVPSLPQRCVAAGPAACVSALVTNPLDAIKTRMQTISAPYSSASASSVPRGGGGGGGGGGTTTTVLSTSSSSNYTNMPKVSLGNASASTATVTNGTSSGSFFAQQQQRQQQQQQQQLSCPPKCPTNANGVANCVSAQCTTYEGNAWTVMRKIVRREGISALWRGTKTALIMAGPAVGVYLPCYDFIRDYCVTRELVQNEDMAPLVAGAGARTIAVFAVAPLELMRTRQLAAQESRGSFMNGSSQRRSLLFTGVSSTLIRDVPFSMMYWYSVEKLRLALADRFTSDNPKVDNLAAAFVGGNIAGAAISAVTTPGDVLKTRIQVNATHSNNTSTIAGEHIGGRTGPFREMANLVKHEGASSLFRGWIPRALRGGPTCGIVLVAYELVKSLDY